MRKLSLGIIGTIILTSSCARNVPVENEIIQEAYVHKYGIEVPKNHWDQAGQTGQVISTLKNGIVCKQNYYYGKLEGETTYFSPYGNNLEKSEFYSQDILKKEVFYFPSGQPQKQIVYDQPGHTLITEWYSNEQLKSFEKYSGSILSYGEYYDENGTRLAGIEEGIGIKPERDPFGLLIFTDSFKNGKVEFKTLYYPNGSPKEINPYKDGIVEGTRKTYLPGGEPKTIETWVNGKQEGMTTVFVEGQKTQEITYVNGIKNGITKIYKDGVSVIQEQTWKDDKLHGPTKNFHEGNIGIDWYYKGNKVTKGYYDSFLQFGSVDSLNSF